jgi:hypothetical protein
MDEMTMCVEENATPCNQKRRKGVTTSDPNAQQRFEFDNWLNQQMTSGHSPAHIKVQERAREAMNRERDVQVQRQALGMEKAKLAEMQAAEQMRVMQQQQQQQMMQQQQMHQQQLQMQGSGGPSSNMAQRGLPQQQQQQQGMQFWCCGSDYLFYVGGGLCWVCSSPK